MTKDQEWIVNAFQQLLSKKLGWRADIEGLHLQCLNFRETEVLELPFIKEEIHSTLMEMNGNKPPGPDVFTMAFWQACWDFVNEEIVVLRTLGILAYQPFRGLYKLLAKVLANRLKKVLGNVVYVDQNAFVMSKQILDASLIANEVIDFWHKHKDKWLICKLDIEKAYDNINWNFLIKVLHKMDFGSRWMEWIWWCISTTKFFVLVIGVPTGFFLTPRGCVKEILFLLTFCLWYGSAKCTNKKGY
ncbi:Transposon TX1 uncharacterized 149 kDa protein [Vitis vinifera]|uniref:Transposon TX1 uncharacterized 149 kDa protein n=1 Tax=Vitis vinifera TaxID=29760 RepID=A0A438IK62_VITVI|nr:Transposon TX1 uncharacterized 149 kDa protein [Vitis vinifera]